MNNEQLKAAIASDIRTIGSLDADIIPAPLYYGAMARAALGVYCKFFVIMGLAFAWSFALNSKTSTPASVIGALEGGAILAFLLGAIATLLLLRPVSLYVQFRFHLEHRLLTAPLILRKIRLAERVFFGVFAVLCALFSSYASDMQILFLLIFAFAVSFGVTSFLMGQELNRIGISTLFTAGRIFFDKEKVAHLTTR